MTGVYCPRCQTRWHQAGNRTGHCSQCHQTFSGESTFDAHQRRDGDQVICRDLSELTSKTGALLWRTFVDSEGATVWRSAQSVDPSVFKGRAS